MNIFALGISHHFSCNVEISLRELFALVIALRSVMVHSCVQVFVKTTSFLQGLRGISRRILVWTAGKTNTAS